MASALSTMDRAAPIRSGPRSFLRRLADGDQIAHLITLVFAASILLITTMLVYQLWIGSTDARHKFGWHFFFTTTWDPVAGDFGALPFIYGTLVTSALALLIAVPLGLGAAIFLAELAPRSISDGLAFLIDLLAAAMEKFRFAPHCGQCEVPTPASDPHFGQMRGRCAAGSE